MEKSRNNERLLYIYAKISSMSLADLFRKIFWRLLRTLRKKIDEHKYRHRDIRNSLKSLDLLSVIEIDRYRGTQRNDIGPAIVFDCYLSHRYELLGSGWRDVSFHLLKSSGLRSKCQYANDYESGIRPAISFLIESYRQISESICELLDDEYRPIDWQRDVKSGYRWDVGKVSTRLSIVVKEGVDVKVPWELARLQHLPLIALRAIDLKDGMKSKHIREVRNQILDFMIMNPPGYGINWYNAMEVGIRAANMLVAFDICRQVDNGKIFTSDFEFHFSKFVYAHGHFIVNNLEYSSEKTSNHYLANIVGLLYVAIYLETTDETSSWLDFAIQEFIDEVDKQFYADGTNYEGSSSYHRLSTEMAVFGAAMIAGLSPEKKKSLIDVRKKRQINRLLINKPSLRKKYISIGGEIALPVETLERIERAGLFCADIRKPNGDAVQYGDNDSGRFITLTKSGSLLDLTVAAANYLNLERSSEKEIGMPGSIYWDENALDHGSTSRCVEALFGRAEGTEEHCSTVESAFIRSIKGQLKYPYMKEPCNTLEKQLGEDEANDGTLPYKKRIEIVLRDVREGLLHGLSSKHYRNGGVYILKSKRMYLALLAVPNGLKGSAGHNHNDQLSMELNVDGKDICMDPGTYLYTPDIVMRNALRSVQAHNTLRSVQEPNRFFSTGEKIFMKMDESRCGIAAISDTCITMQLRFRNVLQKRKVTILYDRILIEDYSTCEFDNTLNPSPYYSNGYGKLKKMNVVADNVDIIYG